MMFMILVFASIFHHVATGKTLNPFHPTDLTTSILSLQKLVKHLNEGDALANIRWDSRERKSKSCEFSLQAQSNRLSLFLYYPTSSSEHYLLDLHPETFNFLADCKWDMNVTSYTYDADGNVTDTINGIHTGGRFDAIGFARNVVGNSHVLPNTCALIWQGTNDDLDWKYVRKLLPLKLQPAEAPYVVMGKISTRISKQTYDIVKPFYTTYIERVSKPATQFAQSLLNSDECKNILIVGHSLGGTLASIYRIDVGEVYEGMYTQTCFGAKPCNFFSLLGTGALWYGNVPEYATYSNSTVMVYYETDPSGISLQTWLGLLPLETQKVLHSHGFSKLVEPKGMLLRWRTRDVIFHTTDDGPAARRVVYDIDIVNTSFWEFHKTPAYVSRLHEIASLGPLVSVRVCFAGVVRLQGRCDHSAVFVSLEDFVKMDDEAEKGDMDAEQSGITIPDLPGSSFNRLISLLAHLNLISK
jgi:hypothetical protein